ncbi:kinase-like protein, partial [Nadsonia fulvescens var. elongata DSM 6958]
KGKLNVKIIEAKGLNVVSQIAHPYVVCTCDSNEFITPGPSIKPVITPLSNNRPNGGNPNGGIDIPSRQSSNITFSSIISATNPQWKDEAIFDVVSEQTNVCINIYDANNGDMFLGQVEFTPDVRNNANVDKWYKLEHRVANTEQHQISGEIRVRTIYYSDAAQGRKQAMKPNDFEILSLVGKGTFGQVYQVRKKDTQRIYAMKVLSKKIIVQKKEIAHTIGERNILVRTSTADSPFIVGLKFSFQTETDLYLITDYMSGGELFWHLQKEGRFQEDRAKFYIAELILALEHLHNNDIVYRDLKPENILLDANGHIALCDFGLSKANLSSNGTTNTFCGTTEYLAPEIILDDQGYTKMVDFWSLGVLIFEMCCGWSPFYAEDTQQMYKNIAFGKVRFPKDALSQEGRNFVKGLLNRNPKHRLGAFDDARELRQHAFFNDINWEHLAQKKIVPPFKPHTTSELDTSNFDPEFTETSSSVLNLSFMPNVASTPLSPGIQANFQGFTYVGESTIEEHFKNNS